MKNLSEKQKALFDALHTSRTEDMKTFNKKSYRGVWSSIIDKYTVHAALNHMDESMKVTDIYIERDFAIENNANAKVIDYVFNR